MDTKAMTMPTYRELQEMKFRGSKVQHLPPSDYSKKYLWTLDLSLAKLRKGKK